MTDARTPRRGPRPAQERLRRLLVMLPWLMERGDVGVTEVAERFGLSEQHVIADLERASLCGLPPYVDEMIDLYIDDGIVHVGVPRLFTRPLRLTASEGFSLLAAGTAALELPGADRDGPLGRAMAKLARSLGDTPALAVEIERPPLLDVVQHATDAAERVAISYWSASRDELTERTIAPQATFVERGHWYVVADDSRHGDERTFRVDRIDVARPTGEHFTKRAVNVPIDGQWFAGADGTEVVMTIPADAAWVVERYPVRAINALGDGRVDVRLAVVSDRWLARLLLRIGPGAEIVEPDDRRHLSAQAAATVLARYQ